jgi:hypothetical protein
MSKVATTNGGGDRGGISLDFRDESLESLVRGLAMESREHLVLEVSVNDTGDLGGHGRPR